MVADPGGIDPDPTFQKKIRSGSDRTKSTDPDPTLEKHPDPHFYVGKNSRFYGFHSSFYRNTVWYIS